MIRINLLSVEKPIAATASSGPKISLNLAEKAGPIAALFVLAGCSGYIALDYLNLQRQDAGLHQELVAARERGETGYPLLWRIDRAAILDDLERWLDRERADAQPFDSHDYEVRFGRPYRGGEPVGPLTSDEPLRLECRHFLSLIAGEGDATRVAQDGLAVVRVLEQLQASPVAAPA